MRLRRICGAGLSVLFGLWLLGAGAQTTGPHYVVGWVPVEPGPIRSDGAFHFVYEIQFTSYFPLAQRIESIEVRADDGNGAVLARYEGEELAGNILRPGNRTPDAETLTLLEPGDSALVYFMASSPTSDPIPERLFHRVTFSRVAESEQLGAGGAPGALEMAVAVRPTAETVVIGAPLKGGPWLVGNGLSNTSGHRRTPLPQDGRTDFAQRYAIDYVMPAGPNGEIYDGDQLVNDSHYAYGQEIIAVADGVVTIVADGMIDNPEVGKVTDQVQISLDNAGGNTLVLDIGDGRYAAYAHIKPGTIRVAPGDRVKRGQVLGLVGNTGNSTAPHLHFHLGDRGDHVLRTEGIPYVHHQYEWLGTCELGDGEEAVGCDLGQSEMRFGEMPKRDDVVSFP